MKLKTIAKLSIVCLSLSALAHLTRDVWVHQLLLLDIFDDSRTLFRLANAIEVLLYHVPLIIFFTVLYRKQHIDELR